MFQRRGCWLLFTNGRQASAAYDLLAVRVAAAVKPAQRLLRAQLSLPFLSAGVGEGPHRADAPPASQPAGHICGGRRAQDVESGMTIWAPLFCWHLVLRLLLTVGDG